MSQSKTYPSVTIYYEYYFIFGFFLLIEYFGLSTFLKRSQMNVQDLSEIPDSVYMSSTCLKIGLMGSKKRVSFYETASSFDFVLPPSASMREILPDPITDLISLSSISQPSS